MKQLRGLLMKEWIQMKSWLYVLLLMGAFILFVGPTSLKRIFGLVDSIGTIGFMTGLMLIFLHSFVVLIMFVATLGKDMARQDVWFHTPSSMFKLIVAKLIFSVFVISVSIAFISLITFGYLNMTLENTTSKLELVKFALLVDGATISGSVYVACIGFFFWVIYQTLRMRIRILAGPITIGLFFFINYWWDKILASPFFTKTFNIMGEIPLQRLLASDLVEKTFEFDVYVGPSLQIGEILFIAVITILLFFVSVIWFDKKVRV